MVADAETVDLLALTHDGAQVHDAFFRSTAPYVAFLAGIGVGKTTLLVYDAFAYAEDWPGSTQIFTEPTAEFLKDVALKTIDRLYGPGRGGRYDWTESSPINVKFAPKWGLTSEIWLRAADSVGEERRRGPNTARVLMDEVTLGDQEEAFDALHARNRDKRFPILQTKVAGTPRGRNWVWKKFLSQPLEGSEVFFAITQDSEDAGFVPKGYTAGLMQQYGGKDSPKAMQELGGQFLEMAGQVFPEFRRNVHVRAHNGGRINKVAEGLGGSVTDVNGGEDGEGRRADAGILALGASQEGVGLKQVLGGIDFGAVSPTALIVAGLDSGGRLWVVDEWYKHEAGMDDLIEAIGALSGKWHITRWICDPAGKADMTKLRNAGIRATAARHRNRYQVRVPIFKARLTVRSGGPGMYFDPSCVNLIGETEGLMWRRRKLVSISGDDLQDEFDRGTPDHAVDALTNIIAELDMGYKSIPQITGPSDRWVG